MYCRICGSEKDVKFYPAKRQSLCKWCAADTPSKLSRDEFEKRYWGAEVDTVPTFFRREFYSDYLASDCDMEKYIDQTTSSVL